MFGLLKRSHQAELLDGPNLPPNALARNFREIAAVNRLLGGYSATLIGLDSFAFPDRKVTLCDFGCGGGDTLVQIAQWARRKGHKVRLLGIDHNPDIVAIAQANTNDYPEIEIVCDDFYSPAVRDLAPDIGLTALFNHHLTDAQNMTLLQHLREMCTLGFVINDLHRHSLAYASIYAIGRVMRTSYLFQHDAPLSVARSLRRNEWHAALNAAGITTARIRWVFAFRWCITYHKSQA